MALKTKLLETSLAVLCDREAEFTAHFYNTLFSDYPQVKPLFKNTQMDQQAKKLFASLVLVVNNLHKPQVLTDSLKGMGIRHLKYGVLPEHYPMVGNTLLKVMAIVLRDQWTPELEKAWTEAYSAMAELLLDGANYPESSLSS
ncbi:MAG: flavohemoprotein [Leptolyngbya sp. SIO1D8]|nr:flavohemoprotein [Leptolyngbya sp. SIO1D8]